MSTTDGEEQQVLRLTIEEALVLRGAFNVVCEILGRPGLEIPPGTPVSRDRKALFDSLEMQLNRRLDEPVTDAFTDPTEASFTQPLGRFEAQAVRDVAGALETMLQDPAGRELLVAVGFLADSEQPVDREEIATLRDIIQRIDPTGAREAPQEPRQANGGIPLVADNATDPEDRSRFFPDRRPRRRTPEEQLSRIDRLRSGLEDDLARPELIDIDEDEVEGIVRSALPRAREADDCDELLVGLAELAHLGARAVEGQRLFAPGDVGQERAIREVEDARRLVIAQMDDLGCIPRDDLRDLRNSVLSVTEPLRDDPDDVETRAFAALSDVHNVFRDPRRGGMGMAA